MQAKPFPPERGELKMEGKLERKARSQNAARPRMNFAGLGRAIRYLGHYKNLAVPAYLFLFIATGAMLMVPQLVQTIIDALTNGYTANLLSAIPAAFQSLALPAALQKLGWTMDQYNQYLHGSETAIITAGLLIMAFAVASGLFAYGQTYMSERTSQSVAFDFRNDLYARIQRLSFSYHDRNQTGQLMIRAT